MNERIKELEQLADAYAKAEYEKWTPTPDFSGIPNIRKIFNAKFAELLVQEFLFIIDDEQEPEMVSRIKLWKQVKEHFGVEE